MICPNCKHEIIEENAHICPFCKVDYVLFVNILNLSIKSYNEGLNKVKNSDLSGAISSLKESISYDMNNYNARNVLGLIYFEIGLIADALKQFIISSSILKDNNRAVGYLDKLRDSNNGFEKYNDAAALYNKALIYLEQGNEAFATNSLKRALNLNPKFINALNLLSLCYIKTNKKNKAKELIDRVLEIDKENITALKYNKAVFDIIDKDPNSYNYKTKTMLIDNKPSANIISNLEKNNGSSLLINYLISFLVGGTLVLFIFYAWILPYNKRVHDLTVDAINTAYDQEKSDYENHIRTLSQTEELLKLENGELNSLLDMLRSQVSLNDKMNNIDLAINKMDSREYDVAYYIINTIDADGLSDEYIQKYENLKTEAPAKAAGELYIAAMLDYDAKKYEEAIVRFEKARDIKEDADILYYLAMSESALGNQDRAAELFNIIIESYSTSLQFNNAQNRLNELTPPPSP